MNTLNGLTIAICTKDRTSDLFRCLASIAAQQNILPTFAIEVIVVDDGELTQKDLSHCNSLLDQRFRFRYIKKDSPGLLLSRIVSVQNATFDLILFLDDDVEINSLYINTLLSIFKHEGVVAVGGIDIWNRQKHVMGMFWDVIFLFNSFDKRKLSLTGFGGSMEYWVTSTDSFQSEFLYGCNMAFRKEVLINLGPVPWLQGYSLGEDIYLSICARKYGLIIVSPTLTVNHYLSPVSRDKQELVAYYTLVNHYNLLVEQESTCLRKSLLIWTALGLLLKAALKRQMAFFGFLKGIGFLLRQQPWSSK